MTTDRTRGADIWEPLVLELEAERDAALARLGAIAALVDGRCVEFVTPYTCESEGRHINSPQARGGYCLACRVAALLADSAGAIAKHEQEVRSLFTQSCGVPHPTDYHLGCRLDQEHDGEHETVAPWSHRWPRSARADALTEGQAT